MHISFRRLTLIILLAASINLGWQFYRLYREGVEREIAAEHGMIVCKFGPSKDEASRMYIELFLLVAYAGVRLRGLSRTFLTVAGLTGVAVSYLLWWKYYFWLREIAEFDPRFVKQTVYLYGGTVLDIVIAAATGWLVILHLHNALRAFVSDQPTT